MKAWPPFVVKEPSRGATDSKFRVQLLAKGSPGDMVKQDHAALARSKSGCDSRCLQKLQFDGDVVKQDHTSVARSSLGCDSRRLQHAALVQQQDVSLPSSRHGCDSRRPLCVFGSSYKSKYTALIRRERWSVTTRADPLGRPKPSRRTVVDRVISRCKSCLQDFNEPWRSLVARWSGGPEVVGANPTGSIVQGPVVQQQNTSSTR